MKRDIILKVEDVSKQYRLGLVGTGTISHDLNRWFNNEASNQANSPGFGAIGPLHDFSYSNSVIGLSPDQSK